MEWFWSLVIVALNLGHRAAAGAKMKKANEGPTEGP
jgi:hypothetical protein